MGRVIGSAPGGVANYNLVFALFRRFPERLLCLVELVGVFWCRLLWHPTE